MLQQGLQPDVITYSALITACEKGGMAERALQVFDKMLQQGLQPDVITYSALIHACKRGGMGERASQLFDEMRHLQ